MNILKTLYQNNIKSSSRVPASHYSQLWHLFLFINYGTFINMNSSAQLSTYILCASSVWLKFCPFWSWTETILNMWHSSNQDSSKCIFMFVRVFVCYSVTLCYSVLQVPFREAHGLSGKAVFTAESRNIALNQLTVDDLSAVRWAVFFSFTHMLQFPLQSLCLMIFFFSPLFSVSLHFSPLFGSDVSSVWDYRSSVEQYSAPGGTAKSSVAAQVEHLRNWLKKRAQWPQHNFTIKFWIRFTATIKIRLKCQIEVKVTYIWLEIILTRESLVRGNLILSHLKPFKKCFTAWSKSDTTKASETINFHTESRWWC